ncbi:MAG TPA: hypothetical protein VHD63_11805 [Ktedonobacteraceae bacterium]|nr:hypothetical protein [Ktedonobacteraceae bacterium]
MQGGRQTSQISMVRRIAMSTQPSQQPVFPSSASTSLSFRAKNLDLLLSVLIALGLPFGAAQLFLWTNHAIWGLLLYYGVCCVGVVWWRKGSLGYQRPRRWPWLLMAAGLLIDLATAALNFQALPDAHAAMPGFVLTILLWVPLNSAMEQLSWIYVLDAWRTRWPGGPLRWLGLAIGILLTLALISLIHTRFWLLFLPTATSANTALVVILSLLLTATQIGAYYRSGSMWSTWLIHFFSDLQLVLLAHYSLFAHL